MRQARRCGACAAEAFVGALSARGQPALEIPVVVQPDAQFFQQGKQVADLGGGERLACAGEQGRGGGKTRLDLLSCASGTIAMNFLDSSRPSVLVMVPRVTWKAEASSAGVRLSPSLTQ